MDKEQGRIYTTQEKQIIVITKAINYLRKEIEKAKKEPVEMLQTLKEMRELRAYILKQEA
jgi:hypothetical protein